MRVSALCGSPRRGSYDQLLLDTAVERGGAESLARLDEFLAARHPWLERCA